MSNQMPVRKSTPEEDKAKIQKYVEMANVTLADFIFELGKLSKDKYRAAIQKSHETNVDFDRGKAIGSAIAHFETFKLLQFLSSGFSAFETHKTRMDELLKEFEITPPKSGCCGE